MRLRTKQKLQPLLQTQYGAVLPSILGILVLILIISTQLTDTVLSNHKTNNAFQSQLQAESLAEYALSTTEQELLETKDRPIAVQTLAAISPNSNQITQNKVWQRSLANYNLDINQDSLTGDTIDWTRQPKSWWDTHANKYSRNLSATNVQTAYSIVEEYDEDFSGSDLGQARDHYSGPSRMLYQITSRGEGGAFGTSRLRTVVAKIYR